MKKADYRFYELPPDIPILALLGEKWEVVYGTDELHFHNYLEIGYCYYGDGKIVFGDREERYGAGTITIIQRNVPHRTVADSVKIQKWEYLFVDTDAIIRDFFKDRPDYSANVKKRLETIAMVLPKEKNSEIKADVVGVLQEMRNKGEFYRYIAKTSMFKLLLECIRLEAGEDQNEGRIVPNADSLEYLKKVLSYIEIHYKEDIKMKDLISFCGLSETHLRRIFQEYVNESPMNYLNLYRIDKSCELLSKTNESVEEIAKRVGFSTSSTYMRNFKKITGKAPHQWRKAVRENPQNVSSYQSSILKGW